MQFENVAAAVERPVEERPAELRRWRRAISLQQQNQHFRSEQLHRQRFHEKQPARILPTVYFGEERNRKLAGDALHRPPQLLSRFRRRPLQAPPDPLRFRADRVGQRVPVLAAEPLLPADPRRHDHHEPVQAAVQPVPRRRLAVVRYRMPGHQDAERGSVRGLRGQRRLPALRGADVRGVQGVLQANGAEEVDVRVPGEQELRY